MQSDYAAHIAERRLVWWRRRKTDYRHRAYAYIQIHTHTNTHAHTETHFINSNTEMGASSDRQRSRK